MSRTSRKRSVHLENAHEQKKVGQAKSAESSLLGRRHEHKEKRQKAVKEQAKTAVTHAVASAGGRVDKESMVLNCHTVFAIRDWLKFENTSRTVKALFCEHKKAQKRCF